MLNIEGWNGRANGEILSLVVYGEYFEILFLFQFRIFNRQIQTIC